MQTKITGYNGMYSPLQTGLLQQKMSSPSQPGHSLESISENCNILSPEINQMKPWNQKKIVFPYMTAQCLVMLCQEY